MALWWDSTLNLTLDTVSILVTQYNNTFVTHTTTIYEDVSSINISTFSQGQSIAFSVLTAIDPEYEANGFALNNGTNAFVDGSFSVAYPTPFIGIQGFEYISVTQQDPHCPNGLQSAGQYYDTPGECACMMQTYMDNPDVLQYAITSQITLSSTYYELGDPHPVGNDLQTELEGPVPINNVSYFDFIKSVLGSAGFNKYRSCAFLDVGVGPPALMIPVAALTATTTSTIKSAGNYGLPSPKPGSPIAPVAAAQTSNPVVPLTPPLVPIVNSPEPAKESPSPPSPANSPANEPAQVSPQGPVDSPSGSDSTDQTSNNGGQPAVGSSDSSKPDQINAGPQPVTGPPSENENGGGSETGDTKPVPVAIVAISYAGSSITPDTSSYYSLPEIGRLSPGSSAVTTNDIVYSLAPSATALISDGQTVSLPTFVAPAPGNVKQAAAPTLTLAGSTYTLDASSHIIVAGQTLVPGAPAIIVSSTPISLAHDALVAVVGSTTQSLYPTAPPAYPEITFAGATYTANSDSAIVIQGQTLIPGASAILISNTPISLAPGASVAVVAGQTQSLFPAGPTAKPVLTVGGSTYTANAASAFVIAGQTLSPGGVISVSSTPISLAAGASFAVIAGLTQSLALVPAPTGPPTFTFNGSTYTAGTDSDFLIGSQTLSEGGVVTVAGTVISYASNGGDVVVGTSTEAVNIGGLIMSGFGTGGASTTGPIQFTGGAKRTKDELPWWLTWVSLGGMVFLGL